MSVRRGLSIRTLLLGAHAFIWLFPLGLFSLLRIYDVYLLRQTEHQLIAESVVIAEAYREALLRAEGLDHDNFRPPAEFAHGLGAARGPSDETFAPVEARVDFAAPVLPREGTVFPTTTRVDPHAEAAGAAVTPILRRAQTFNLSAIRVLDGRGCVVASTRGQLGACLSGLPEVATALAGHYEAVLRERISDEPTARLGDLRRRGKVRVFTALPVWSNGSVVAVVRASRTGLDALSSLWANRRGLLWFGLAAFVFVVLVSGAFSAAIARPLARLTRAAQLVARGGAVSALSPAGRVPRELALLHDVLFQMAQKLDARAHYVNEFASQVSHELKTPITAVRGAAELLLGGLDDMPAQDRKRFLGNILADAHRMERLVARLLTLARVENPGPKHDIDVDPNVMVPAMLQRYGASVALTLGDDCGHVNIDPEELESVLTNLVENALRHGAGEPVQVTLSRAGARLAIAVHDAGKGVSESNRKRLFERFFTTDRDHGGTGLGLAIVKAIAEARGGSVAAVFDAQGSTFSVLL